MVPPRGIEPRSGASKAPVLAIERRRIKSCRIRGALPQSAPDHPQGAHLRRWLLSCGGTRSWSTLQVDVAALPARLAELNLPAAELARFSAPCAHANHPFRWSAALVWLEPHACFPSCRPRESRPRAAPYESALVAQRDRRCKGSDLNRRALAYEASEVTRLLNPAVLSRRVERRSNPSEGSR
jgi:hypothetical protein